MCGGGENELSVWGWFKSRLGLDYDEPGLGLDDRVVRVLTSECELKFWQVSWVRFLVFYLDGLT